MSHCALCFAEMQWNTAWEPSDPAPGRAPKMLQWWGVAAVVVLLLIKKKKPVETPIGHLKMVLFSADDQFGKHFERMGQE